MFKIISAFAGLALVSFAQVEPYAGQWTTWVIPSGRELRVPPPPVSVVPTAELQFVRSYANQRNEAMQNAIQYWDAGSPAYRWMQIALQTVASSTLAGPQQTRALALVAVAISDATIAAWDSKYAYDRERPSQLDPAVAPVVAVPASPSYPCEYAATAGAASAVLSYLFPDQAAKFADMANQAGLSRVWAGVAFPSDVSAGLDLGGKVGRAVADYARSDGSDRAFTGTYPAKPGVWSSASPVTPLAGTWKPWVIENGSAFRLAAPPAFGTDDANAQYAAVKSLSRTNPVSRLAWFWQPGFYQLWLQQVDTEIFQNHLDRNPPRSARAYAYETVAQHDAAIACWDSKYTYLELRPSQADATISTLFGNPQHPGYPSGHACASGASAAVLSYLFPSDAAALAAMATDAGTSTFNAGIHTQLDVSQGLAQGGSVGKAVVARAQSDGAK